MNTQRWPANAFAIVCVFVSTAAGADRPDWADQRLPTIDGMMLWLDASAQPAAAAANKVDTLRDGAALESWYDSSGHSRHARQPDEKARPTLRLKNERGFIRFEGRAACFVSNGLGPPQRDLTVFLVAAPAGNEGNFRALFCTRKKGEDDFKSGLNIDLGPYRTESFDTLNVEGSGIVTSMDRLKALAAEPTCRSRWMS
jgi:hypothetical protein